MTENKTEAEALSRIKDITLEIAFHENRIAMHKSAIQKLRKEKSILMMNGEWVKMEENKMEQVAEILGTKINIEIKEIKTYSIEKLTNEQMVAIYRALMEFEPTYPGGEETRNELIEAMRGWNYDGRE